MSPVPPDRVAHVWQWVRKGLDEILARWSESWTTGDVYNALIAGHATLYIAGQDDGFLIARMQVDRHGPLLFVWIVYGNLAATQEQQFKFIDDLARNVGADRIRMESPRKGWQRKGFKVKTMIYEREVS